VPPEPGPPLAATFRRATNRDCALAQRIVGDALGEHGLDLVLEAGDRDLTDLEHHYDQRGGRFEILEAPGGAPLGVLGWRLTGDGLCELKKLYLVAAARGLGLGRRAVDRVVAEARTLGCRAVVLETAAVLDRANQLYLRAGFVPVRGAAAGPFATLTAQCDLAYRLDLAAP
jgi:GNAT superfamily N-acetyltransferase